MNCARSHAFGSLLTAALIALLLSLAAGGARARGHSASVEETAAPPQQAAPPQTAAQESSTQQAASSEASSQDEDTADPDERRALGDWDQYFNWTSEGRGHLHRHRHGDTIVNFGADSKLPAGARADAVVSILGSSSSEGDAGDVVSVFGSTRVSGHVQDSAVAVFGSTYVDGAVGGDVVAVFGNVKLGPNADVGGDVAAVGGTVTRDPAATVHGDVQSVGGFMPGFGWLQPWIEHCLLYGRPLALVPGIGWAWALAISLLVLYLGLAVLFRGALTECASTVESHPGTTLIAALLTMLLTPILIVLLCITVVGIAAIPFLLFGLFCAGLFGKAVMLAVVGRRVTGTGRSGVGAHPALAVLIGGLIVLGLYLVPVLGLLLYKLLGLFGLGAVVYTAILASRARRGPQRLAPAPAGGPSGLAAGAADAASAMAGAAPEAGPIPAPGPAPGPVPAAASEPPINAALPRAGFWIRMGALLLDAVLIGVVTSFLHHDLELVLLAAYGAVMWKLRGSTIGGIVFDLRVVRLDGRPIDWETAIVRALGCFLSLAVAGLGFFWIAFDGAKQAWHDKIAGTVVVRVAKGVPLV